MTGTADTGLKEAFLKTQYAALAHQIVNDADISYAQILIRLQVLATEGSQEAYANLARLHAGQEVTFDDGRNDHQIRLPEAQRIPELAYYLAMTADPTYTESNYERIYLAEILLAYDDADSRLMALSHIMKSFNGSTDTDQSAAALLRQHFANSDIIDFVKSYKPGAPLQFPSILNEPKPR